MIGGIVIGANPIAGLYERITPPARPEYYRRPKQYLFKIYDSDDNFLTTWTDVVSPIGYTWEMNGGISSFDVELARKADNFGEGEDVNYENVLKLYCFDKDTDQEGILIYTGRITRYIPSQNGSTETVKVTFQGFWQRTQDIVLESGGATGLSYLSEDPSDIMEDLLTKYQSAGGELGFSATSIEATSTSVSYYYNLNTYQEAISKIIQLCPDGWFFRINPDNVVDLKEKSTTADHTFHIGRNCTNYVQEKRTENMVNTIYFTGGDVTTGTFTTKLYKKYTRAGSVSNYGTHAKKVTDGRVTTESTADIIAGRILDQNDTPEVRITLTVNDNNIDEELKGYDIESIKPGDTCKILGATSKGGNFWDEMLWDVDKWDYDITNVAATVLQISKITYSPTEVTLEITNRQPDVNKRIEDIDRNLTNTQTVDNPDTPTT